MNFDQIIQTIAVYAIPVLLAITIHEAAHGYVAKMLGDKTASMLGRVTLNPLKHIDPVGTFLIPALVFIASAGSFMFGYAKPVPVRFDQLRHPKRDMIWVALAGPASNLLQAILWALLFVVLQAWMRSSGNDSSFAEFMLRMCKAGVGVNLVLFVLNLFRLPPLDGGRVLAGLAPSSWSPMLAKIERFGFFIVLGLLVSGLLARYWLEPLMGASYQFIDIIISPLSNMLSNITAQPTS